MSKIITTIPRVKAPPITDALKMRGVTPIKQPISPKHPHTYSSKVPKRYGWEALPNPNTFSDKYKKAMAWNQEMASKKRRPTASMDNFFRDHYRNLEISRQRRLQRQRSGLDARVYGLRSYGVRGT